MNHLIHPYLDSFSIHSFQNHILNSFEIAIDRHNAKLRFPRNYSLNLRYLLIALRSIFRRVFIEKPCVSYRTFGSGCLNASRIVVTNAASRLSFTYASRFDIRPDSRVRFHTRTIFCSQMDEIRLSENYWPVKLSIYIPHQFWANRSILPLSALSKNLTVRSSRPLAAKD